MASYVKNSELRSEIIISLEKKQLTPKAVKMLMLIAHRSNYKLPYTDPMDKEDCIGFAILDLLKYRDRYDPVKYDNPFSYYTQIAKNGFAKGRGKLHPKKYDGTVSMHSSSNVDSDGIYSL